MNEIEKPGMIVSGGMAEDDRQLMDAILKLAPLMSQDDLRTSFIALRMEYGEDALHAVQNGHVQFEERKPH